MDKYFDIYQIWFYWLFIEKQTDNTSCYCCERQHTLFCVSSYLSCLNCFFHLHVLESDFLRKIQFHWLLFQPCKHIIKHRYESLKFVLRKIYFSTMFDFGTSKKKFNLKRKSSVILPYLIFIQLLRHMLRRG